MGREDFRGTTEQVQRQPYLGRGLFAGGIVFVLLAVALAASASVAGAVGLGPTGARELAGALAGIGLAATLVGGLAIVPTDRRTWRRGIGGVFIALCGVGAFLFAYPGQWYGDGTDLTLPVLAVYALGVVTVAAYLFTGVADLARRLGHAQALSASIDADSVPDATEDEAGRSDLAESHRTGGRNEPTTDMSGGEVLYERASDSNPSASGAGTDTTAATDSAGVPTIDRLEPAAETAPWPDSGFTIEPIERSDATIRSRADDPVHDRSEANPTGDGNRTGVSTNEDDRDDSDRPAVTVAANGSGMADGAETVALSTADTRRATTSTVEGRSATDSTDAVSSASAAESTDPGTATTDTGLDRDTSTDRAEPSADGGVDAIQFGPSVDRYCGNCAHFRYVRTDDGLSPYCGYHDEVMDDMEPCLEWSSNA